MWLAVLGPLLIDDGETRVELPRGRLRVLLAALLLHAGTPVAADTLAEVLWDGVPPAGAAVTLRTHVLRLRRVRLGPLTLGALRPGEVRPLTERERVALGKATEP